VRETDYKLLIEYCDNVLLGPMASISTISIPWLHVLNEHPSNLAQYSRLFNLSATFLNKKKGNISLHFKSFFRIFKPGAYSVLELGKIDVVIVSHLLNEAQIDGTEDFYFGNIQKEIRDSGKSCLLLMVNHTNKGAAEINAILNPKESGKAVLSTHLGFKKELSIWKNLYSEAKRIGKIAKSKTDDFERKFFSECSDQVVSPFSFTTYRVHSELSAVFKKCNPKIVISTFEGHAWERMVFAAARDVNSKVLCIGYHHTLMFPKQHSAKRPLGERYDPNIILTAGAITASYFESSKYVRSWEIKSVGIHRRKSLHDKLSEDVFSSKKNNCLVAPDGIISEITYMFDFAIKAAAVNPDIGFILRLHPLVTRENLIMEFPRFAHLPQNVFFSSDSLTDDFLRSRWILYRASSTAIYSVLEGLRPFYLSKKDEMSVDSLFGLDSWKRFILDESDLKNYIASDLSNSVENLLNESREAFEFSNKYFLPFNKEIFFKMIKLASINE
jgi:hypothetical protein